MLECQLISYIMGKKWPYPPNADISESYDRQSDRLAGNIWVDFDSLITG